MTARFLVSNILKVRPLAESGDRPDPLQQEVIALFDEFRVPLLRYLSGFGLSLHDGEEILQEVFLSLFQHLTKEKPRTNLRGWLFRVAHNLALKRRIKARREQEASADSGAIDLLIDATPNPEDRLVNAQTHQRVQAVVRALPVRDRRCLFLRAEGLRYREIAEVLDMSLGAVSLSLARSLGRIARASEL